MDKQKLTNTLTGTYSNLFRYCAMANRDREAVYDYDSGLRLAYGELLVRVEHVSVFLTQELKLKKGDCVGIVSGNSLAHIDILLSGFYTGIITSTYNPALPLHQAEEIVLLEKPKVILFDQAIETSVREVKKLLPDCTFISLFQRSSIPGALFYDDIMRGDCKTGCIQTNICLEDIQMYMHTGGTSGTPKSAMISYRSVLFNFFADVLDNHVTKEDCACVFAPFFHTTGINVLMLSLLMTGGRVIIKKKFDPDVALKIIRDERPTVGILVPMMLQLLSNSPEFDTVDFSCYRLLQTGAAPAQLEIMEKYWKRGIAVFNNYGMTEIGPHNLRTDLGTPIEEYRCRWKSVGRPGIFNEVRIVDASGNDVPHGNCGEMWFRGPLTFSGYLGHPKETREAVTDQWVHTGDIARMDENGWYYIQGRKKLMYISGGENVFPVEIEQKLSACPGIVDVCVVGVEDPRWGEVGVALVVSDDQFDENYYQAFIKTELPSIKRPKYHIYVQKIPRNAAGKIDYQSVRKVVRETCGKESGYILPH